MKLGDAECSGSLEGAHASLVNIQWTQGPRGQVGLSGWVYHVAISNFDVVIQNVFWNSPEFTFAFCYNLASIPCWLSVFCILQLSCLDSIFMFCLLHSAIILPRFRVGFLSFAFCNYLASIPCLFSGFWISVPGGHCNIFYVQIGRLYAEILIY